MDNFSSLIGKRKLNNCVFAFLYIDLVLIFRWKWDLDVLWGLVGGFLGVFILELAEKLSRDKLKTQRAIFNTVFFQIILITLCFYCITSSVSFFVSFLLMVIFLGQIIVQVREIVLGGSLWVNWFSYFRVPSVRAQKVYVVFVVIVFILLSFMLAMK